MPFSCVTFLPSFTHLPLSFFQQGVSGTAPLPYVFVDTVLLTLTQLAPRFRSTFIALHEHLDTYLDKRDSANRVSSHISLLRFDPVLKVLFIAL